MKKKELIIIAVIALFVLAGFGFMFKDSFTGGDKPQKHTAGDYTKMPEATGVTNEITRHLVVEQKFVNKKDSISELAVVFNKFEEFEKKENVKLTISLLCDDEILAEETYNNCDIEDQHRVFIKLNQNYSDMSGKELTLLIEGKDNDTGMYLMMQENKDSAFMFGNLKINGTICFTLN